MRILCLVLLAGSLQAQTVPAFLTQLDAQFNTLWQALTNRQATYLRDNENSRLRFWQGVRTHTVIPSNNIPSTADQLTVVVSGQVHSWSTIGLVGGNQTTVSLQVDEYFAPGGRGFVLTASAKDGTNIWVKVMNFGPESRRQIASWQANGVLRR